MRFRLRRGGGFVASTQDNNPYGLDGPTLAALAEMGALLSGCSDAEEFQRDLLDGAARALRADTGAIARWDESEQLLKPGPVLGQGRRLVSVEFLSSRPVTSQLLGQHKGLLLENPAGSLGPSFGDFTSIVAAPMRAGEGLSGMLALASTSASRRFGEGDRLLLELVANFSASVLDSTLEFDRFSHDLRARIVEVTRELNHAMAELARVKSFNENIFESISMGIIVFDRSFAVVFRNRMAEECFPDDRSILASLGRTDLGRRHADYERIVRDVVRMGQVCGFDGVVWSADGSPDRVLKLSLSPLVSGRESVVGGILTAEDVTRRVDIRRRLEASERLAAVGRLASKVAHELNNPLDGILRYIGLAMRVCEGQEDRRPAEYLAEARTGLMRMVRIIGELLEFSRSTVQATDDGSIRTALEDAIKSLTGLAERRQVALKLSMADDVPPLESTSLYQVFTNLVKNAIEATPAGGEVCVGALAAAGAVEVRVADTGPGIPEKKLGAIFEPFYSTKAAGEGTGLGLAICKELVEKQGGALVARNRAEGGAEFVVRIPTQWVRDGGTAAGSGAPNAGKG